MNFHKRYVEPGIQTRKMNYITYRKTNTFSQGPKGQATSPGTRQPEHRNPSRMASISAFLVLMLLLHLLLLFLLLLLP